MTWSKRHERIAQEMRERGPRRVRREYVPQAVIVSAPKPKPLRIYPPATVKPLVSEYHLKYLFELPDNELIGMRVVTDLISDVVYWRKKAESLNG